MDDFETAKDRIMMGAERRSMVMTEDEKKLTAYHEAGHAIGNHGLGGRRFTKVPVDVALDEINEVDGLFEDAGLPASHFVRAPRLEFGWPLAQRLSKNGRVLVGGSAPGNDWDTQDPEAIAKVTLRMTVPGSILVLHDGFDRAAEADRSGSVEAAGIIIRRLKDRGYTFHGLDGLEP